MELEFRDQNGNFLFAIRGVLFQYFMGYFLKEKRYTVENKRFDGKTYRCFVNKTNETLAAKNDFFEVFVYPGSYIKLIE